MRQSLSKKCLGLLSLVLFSVNVLAVDRKDDVVISNSLKVGGTSLAAASAGFELSSITKGLLISRMTTVQRDAIVSPATGLMIYNTTDSAFNFYNGAAWGAVGSGVSALTANRAVVTDGSGALAASATTATQIGYVDVGSSLTTLLAAKAPLASPTFTGTIGTPLTASRVVTTDASGNLDVAATTTSTLAFLDVGSSLTTLLAAKAPLASPTFTGTVTAPTFSGALTGNADTATTAGKWTTARNLAGNSVDGSAAVAFANKFVVQGTTDTGLSGAQFLGALGTGIVKNTTTTGVLSIAVAADFPTLNQNTSGTAAGLSALLAVASGGTHLASGTSGGILAYTASGTLASSAALAANQLIVGGGAGVVPSTLAAGSQFAVLRMGAASPAYGSIDLSQSVAVGTSILGIANGGTGAATKAAGFDALSPMTTSGDIIYGGTSGTGTRLAKGIDGTVLTLAAGIPSWASGLTNPMTTSGDIIYGGASGAPTRLAKGSDTNELVLASGIPSWVASNQTAYVTFGGASESTNCTGSPCTIYRSSNGSITVTRSGTGAYTVNFPAGLFSNPMVCAGVAANNANGIGVMPNGNSTSTTFPLNTINTNTQGAVDAYSRIVCTGPR